MEWLIFISITLLIEFGFAKQYLFFRIKLQIDIRYHNNILVVYK